MMRKLLLFFIFHLFICTASFGQSVFINEIHYDNIGGDIGEFIEVAGPMGTDLSGYTIEFYRDVGTVYTTIVLSGIISNQEGGLGTLSFTPSGIQNGVADGFALIQGTTVIQLLSYEGTLTGATGTTADGLTSTDIGVAEDSSTPIGNSLQLQGNGSDYTDFTWVAEVAETPGSPNNGQTLPVEDYQIDNFKLYPNPVLNGYVNIVSGNRIKMKVSVFDLLGKKVFDKTLNNKILNVAHLSNGVYIIKVLLDDAIVIKKLVIK
jgi:translation initiation factor IF-1